MFYWSLNKALLFPQFLRYVTIPFPHPGKLYSRLACEQRGQKYKLVPRRLSMIVACWAVLGNTGHRTFFLYIPWAIFVQYGAPAWLVRGQYQWYFSYIHASLHHDMKHLKSHLAGHVWVLHAFVMSSGLFSSQNWSPTADSSSSRTQTAVITSIPGNVIRERIF